MTIPSSPRAVAQLHVPCICNRTAANYTLVFRAGEPGHWIADHAVIGASGSGPALDQDEVAGTFHTAPDYACPFCGGASNFYRCGTCRRLNCWDGRPQMKCAWPGCPRHSTIKGYITSLGGASTVAVAATAAGVPAGDLNEIEPAYQQPDDAFIKYPLPTCVSDPVRPDR